MRVTFTKGIGWRRYRWKLFDGPRGVNAGSVQLFYTRFFCDRDFRKYYNQMAVKRDYWPSIAEVEIDG